ncbi:hypothetical protein AWRI3579_g2695 [Hanseniaspora osmophila]|uniref:Bacterial surface antigen (D15) domain-containing protein n=1 Tax=Hanseniaspora osmophila TaxID=56408 RepID=A0A1E5RBP9_9ASCO|nr:hypothetical protein AWRI3579_g2695 [Hanseniaspora osmophila]
MSELAWVKPDVQNTELRDQQSLPLRINKVTVNQNPVDDVRVTTNTATNFLLSEKFYQSLLQPILEQPIQNAHNTIEQLKTIQHKIYQTGLFEHVEFKVDVEKMGQSSSISGPPNGLLPTPLPVSTTINLFPKVLNENFLTTALSTANLNNNEIVLNSIKYNTLGKAEKLLYTLGLKYDLESNSFKSSLAKAQFLFPLPKNPSVNGVFALNYVNSDRLFNDDKHFNFSLGLLKNWKSCELFGGLAFTRRSVGDKSKTSLIGSYIKDKRSFVGMLPVQGSYIEVNNDLVFAQARNGTIENDNANYNNFNMKLDLYKSWFQNALTSSLETSFGAIASTAAAGNSLIVDKEDQLDFPNLKGFQYQSKSIKDLGALNCKAALSCKLPFQNKLSPLRFQMFTSFNQMFNPAASSVNNKNSMGTTSSGLLQNDKLYSSYGWSLIYKTEMADLDLSYTIPVSNSGSSIAAPGFSIGCALSFY